MNSFLSLIFKKIKYSRFYKSLFTRLFLIQYDKIIGDTYSKLWQFEGKVILFQRLEDSTVHCDDDSVDDYLHLDGYRSKRSHDSIDLFLFKNASQNAMTGLINFQKEKYFTDLIVSSLQSLTNVPLKQKYFNGRIFCSFEKNYFHFITEELYPIIRLYENNTMFYVIIAGNSKWKEDLILSFCPKLKVIHINPFQYITADELFGVTKDRSGYIHPNVIFYLRKKLLSLNSIISDTKNELIYISRRMALSRNISNEELFENKLREIGFNVIHTEDLNIEEKVQIFKSARLVVAIHGAGLTNILTMNVDSIVIELIDKRHFSHCYKALAKILALNYFSSIMKVGENGMPYIDIENSIELIKSKI
jgi:hypothetical protein